MLGRAWMVVSAVAAACGDDLVHWDPAHPIDQIVVPKIRELGAPIRAASAEEVCRRMAIDLVGRGPTPDEMTMCGKQTAGEMFDTFTAKPEYTREQRRQWGELLKYDNVQVRSEELYDYDRLVDALYADELSYGEFATQAVMHPTLIALHPDDSWTAYLFNVYLGRPARQDEIDGLRPFVRAWGVRNVCSGAVWFFYYKRALGGGADETAAIAAADLTCFGAFRHEYGINACQCASAFSSGCNSDVLGMRVEISGACPSPQNPADPINFSRVSERSPGDLACPDESIRPECNDRLIDMSTQTILPFVAWQPPTPELLQQMRSVGAALQARLDFWETAADRELRKLLGWWQATFRHADSDIPEVRGVLAEQLRTNGSVRAVQRQIMTSVLYRQPAVAPDIDGVEEMPPWIAGPTKLLSGEPWLATAAAAVGETAGTCDYRAVAVTGYTPEWTDPRLLEAYEGTLDELFSPGYSIAAIGRLGGCNTDAYRFEVSNIGLTFNQADISRGLCAYGRGVVSSGNLVADARQLIRQIWHRAARDGEAESMAADMTACLDGAVGNDVGCANPETAVRWMCQRMIDSAVFAIY